MGVGRVFLFGMALMVALVALAWPQIEQLLISSGYSCPYPFSLIITSKGAGHEASAGAEDLPKYTLDQLRMYDGSDEKKPILIAVGGKVLDVTSGANFYGKGKSYNLFAGTVLLTQFTQKLRTINNIPGRAFGVLKVQACTRALALGSLEKKDINDDISDFGEKQLKELAETKTFYYEKYPVVGELV